MFHDGSHCLQFVLKCFGDFLCELVLKCVLISEV